MFCHRCGTQVASGNQFCTNCGQALGAAPGLAATPAVAWNPPRGIHSNTWHWIGQGWDLVKADIGIYILLALVFFLLNSAVPLILTGPLMAGFHIVCMKKLANKRAEFADLIAGFNFFIPALVASLVISVFIFAGMLACLIPGLVVAAMYKFTYLFIVDKRMDFWQAMQASHAVVKNDYFGFTMFLLGMFLVNVLGFLCFVVGLLVSIPVTIAAITIAYREIVGFEPATMEAL